MTRLTLHPVAVDVLMRLHAYHPAPRRLTLSTSVRHSLKPEGVWLIRKGYCRVSGKLGTAWKLTATGQQVAALIAALPARPRTATVIVDLDQHTACTNTPASPPARHHGRLVGRATRTLPAYMPRRRK